MYWVKTPAWLKMVFAKGLTWSMPHGREPTVYITFDDGPHPTATTFALRQLERYGAQATFFCVGNNVVKYPDVYQQMLEQGHTAANHTYDHINGLKTDNETYLANIRKAAEHIDSRMFRPPYGRIRPAQVNLLKQNDPSWKIYMWDILSGDFDRSITPKQCLDNVMKHIRPGSIVLFHDSEKAWDRMSFALPLVLEYCQKQNWKMKALS